jgi:DNA-binding YbaB/EbfC family protein
MKDLGNLMRQAQESFQKMQQAQEEVAKLEVQGVAGGGMVTVTMNGKHMVKRIEIDDSLLGDDRDMLEDMIAAATNNAVEKVDQASKEKMASVTGGLNIPPGFNFNL